ncbi:hypothetical protein FWK35_00020342 [Aphis craccivora]|uniref:Uncharacterized protein n=1 Tax=Aphis craccivora TaxID=307492 RepID=A0A6G0YFR4_APHCR|nr:hypothetical protein FWK35_00020342 [Aphis craccivora]
MGIYFDPSLSFNN